MSITTTRLPDAPAKVGVQPGWHIPDMRTSTPATAHRLTTSAITGRASSVTLCGRKLVRPRELTAEATGRHACRDCRTKAARALDPDAPVEPEHTPPPPTVRRAPAATTGRQDNTVAARIARRAALRSQFDLSDRAQDYTPRPYGEQGYDPQT